MELRLQQYQSDYQRECYTYSRRPIILRFHQEFKDVLQAIHFEKKVKGWTRAKKKALIEGDFDMPQILAECRNATHHKYQPQIK